MTLILCDHGPRGVPFQPFQTYAERSNGVAKPLLASFRVPFHLSGSGLACACVFARRKFKPTFPDLFKPVRKAQPL
jgi:hypothetical protein